LSLGFLFLQIIWRKESQTQIQQQPMMNRTTSVQPTRKTAQVAQPITQQQQIAQTSKYL